MQNLTSIILQHTALFKCLFACFKAINVLLIMTYRHFNKNKVEPLMVKHQIYKDVW